MAAYRRVYGFGHSRADCRGPGSAPESSTLVSRMGLHYLLPIEVVDGVKKGIGPKLLSFTRDVSLPTRARPRLHNDCECETAEGHVAYPRGRCRVKRRKLPT